MKLTIALLVSLPSLVLAQEKNGLEDLFSDISNDTTQSNINIAHQATTLSVVYAKDLELLGIRILREALDFIPGVEVNTTPSGNERIIMRGSSSPHNAVYENVRFYIDGVDIEYIYYANFPIELIERLEVSRSPSIALYGQGAFAGSVNIITKSSLENTSSFMNLEYGSFNAKKASALFKFYTNGFFIGVDAHYQQHDRKIDASTAQDTIVNGISAVPFPRKRESLEGLEDKGVGLSIYNGTWRFTSRYLQTYTQNYYGTFGLLDFNEEGYTQYTTFDAQISYKSKISSSFNIKANIGYLNNSYQLNTYLYLLDPNTISTAFKNPHYQMDHQKDILFSDISIQNNYFEKHTIDFGINIQEVKITKNDYFTNADANSQVGFLFAGNYYAISDTLTKLNGSNGILNVPNNKQNSISYYLHELYSFNNDLDFTVNIRYDDYDFFDPKASYKLASLYSKDDVNVFKFMYSKSYRIPSLLEAFFVEHFKIIGTPDLKPESIESYELSYSYLNKQEILNFNIYYSSYKNTIELYDSSIDYYYNNDSEQKSYGLELEYTREFNNHSKATLNAAYTQFLYKNNNYMSYSSDTPDASPYTMNLGYIYPFNKSFTWSNFIKYYSSKNLSASSSTIPSSTLVDTVLNYMYQKDLKINLKVKNIFNQNYYYPSVGLGTNPMLREGRTAYLTLEYKL